MVNVCFQCGRIFQTIELLIRHYEISHRDFKCSYYQRGFSTQRSLDDHESNSHRYERMIRSEARESDSQFQR